MKEYFTILLISGIVGSIASVLSDGSSLGKYVKYISALICIIIVIRPLSSVIQSAKLPRVSWDQESASSEGLEALAVKLTEEQISKKITEKFGIIPQGVSIEIDRDENITLSFSLKEEDMELYSEVEKFVSSLCEEK